jgi:excinuclease ABC subunit B
MPKKLFNNPVFTIHQPFQPAGDQPKAIEQLVQARPGINTLLGVTGSGKTYTIAQVIAHQHKPVLILCPNKTLAAQLYEEFSLFFPDNKVCYFVSYYDYYQPESYLPAQDIYIPKETKINDEIERLRIEATASIINRKDTIVIASVSAIYSLGNPTDYKQLALQIKLSTKLTKTDLIKELIFIQYTRNDMERASGTFSVAGTTITIQLPYQKEALRIDLFGDYVEAIEWVTKLEHTVIATLDNVLIFPAKHFVTTKEKKEQAIARITHELEKTLPTMQNPLYAERLKTRTLHDIELLRERGTCPGIENYSSFFDGRQPGSPPFCLFDFFDDFLLIIDESHITIPQLRGMYAGDRARKTSLIDFGFRLPSAYDNRPLMFDEIKTHFKDTIFVSATPGPYEFDHSTVIAEQIIRPTGLVDPIITIHQRHNQIQDLIKQIIKTKENHQRSLVMVMTKKGAEELALYLQEKQIKVCYLHSDIKTDERTELLHKLRQGVFDCLVGVNLLREGIDLPEVAFVAIMDADIESFLRDKRSLIQIIGRAARNINAHVIFYADKITKSMAAALEETERRRTLQLSYNEKHGITPISVSREVTKSISSLQSAIRESRLKKMGKPKPEPAKPILFTTLEELDIHAANLEGQMNKAAEYLDFEKAIMLREQWRALQVQRNHLLVKNGS